MLGCFDLRRFCQPGRGDMGVDLSGIVPRSEIKLESLRRRRIAIDTYIHLYQFITSLPPLTDHKGRPTSHLAGLFYRTTHLMSLGIKPIFVFDGQPAPIERHKKITAQPGQPRITGRISPFVIESSRALLEALGLPVVQAPSEAEAQAAWMCGRGDAWAVASQDFDSLMFGAPRMIMNLTMAKTRRLPSRARARARKVLIGIYLYELKKILRQLKLSHDQLIVLCMLIGTDFNPGIYGVGQKSALDIVRRYGKRFDVLFNELGWSYSYSWKDVFEHIKSMPVTNRYKLRWRAIDKRAVQRLLVKKHDFNEARVKAALERAGA